MDDLDTFFHQAYYKPCASLNSLILMGGRGTRLEPHRKMITKQFFPTLNHYYGQEGPKALTLLTLHGQTRPLLDWHFDIHCHCSYKGGKIDNFYLGLGFACDMITDYLRSTYQLSYQGHSLIVLKEQQPAGTIAALIKMMQLGYLSNQSLVMANGDNFLEFDLYQAYLQGLQYALQAGIDPNKTVINIASSIPHNISDQYGVIDIDNKSHLAISFGEKRPVADNPYQLKNGQKISWINSGFSIIVNPLYFAKTYITDDIVSISQQLEAGQLDYKSYEKKVKYESLYEKLAQEGYLIAVQLDSYWADSGTEALIKGIEAHYC